MWKTQGKTRKKWKKKVSTLYPQSNPLLEAFKYKKKTTFQQKCEKLINSKKRLWIKNPLLWWITMK